MSSATEDSFWKRQLHEGEKDLVDQIRRNVIQLIVRYVRDNPEKSLRAVSAMGTWLLRGLSSADPTHGRPVRTAGTARRPTSATEQDVNPSPGVACAKCGTTETIYLYSKKSGVIDGYLLCARGHYGPHYS